MAISPLADAPAPPRPAPAWQAAAVFANSPPVQVQPYGRGNIHETFLVTTSQGPAFILQRLNTAVFSRPELIMANLRVLAAHLEKQPQTAALPPGRRWQIPRIIPTPQGEDLWRQEEGSIWRALTFIPAAHTVDVVQDEPQAWEVGYALGRFHLAVSSLPPTALAATLPGFHVTPGYLQAYDACRAATAPPATLEAAYAQECIRNWRPRVDVLEAARRRGLLTTRVIHGDPKVNNVLLDDASGLAVGLVDLDTVQPGLIHYDLGDCLRSVGNPWGEETDHWQRVEFDLNLGRALLVGYLSQARIFLAPADYDYIYDSLGLIAFELGLRFFTDYLAGNVYFRVQDPEQNLRRALVQFHLAQSIAAQEKAIRAMIGALR